MALAQTLCRALSRNNSTQLQADTDIEARITRMDANLPAIPPPRIAPARLSNGIIRVNSRKSPSANLCALRVSAFFQGLLIRAHLCPSVAGLIKPFVY